MSGDEPLARGADSDERAVDEMVASVHAGAGDGPGVQMRDVVLVTGPWLAGSTGVAEALRRRLPDRTFVESDELADGDAPAAVVYVISAATPVTESDCALLDSAAANTDMVIGAVSKIDVHQSWRDVLAADRSAVAAHDCRYAEMTWVGVAAAPEDGDECVDELADVLEKGLASEQLSRRNRLRAWQTQLRHTARQHEDAAAGAGREARMAALRQERNEALRERRLAKSQRTIELRNRMQQSKVQLNHFARNRCNSVRGELQDDAASMTRGKLPAFEEYVRRRVHEVVGEVDGGIDKDLRDLAAEFGLTPLAGEPLPASPAVSSPPLATSRLEARLMLLLGAVFGIGVALTLSRLFADLAPAYTAAGLVGGAAVGLVIAVGVVSMRRTLRERAVLDRWVGEVISELRALVEQMVSTRLLQAEPALVAEQAERDEADAAKVAHRVAAIDGELREHGVAAAQASAVRDRELPGLQQALEAIGSELNGERPN